MRLETNVLVKSAGEAFVYTQGDASWFRLRDLACALKNTAAAFDLSWDNGVVLTRGAAYAGASVEDSTMPPAFSEVNLTVRVDGQAVELPAVLMTPGNYCVTAEGLAALLGLSVTETAGEARPGLLIATV